MQPDHPELERSPQPDAGLTSTQETVEVRETQARGLFAWLSHPKAPAVAGVLLVGLLVGAVVVKTKPSFLPGPSLVVFDPVRFINAQRAAASILATVPNADSAMVLTQVAAQAEAVIREEARGATVLVKQTVVASDLIDITDAVLDRFNLSRNVPTVTTTIRDSLENIAPTNSAFSNGKLREDYRLELQKRTDALTQESNKADRQAAALP